MKNYCTQIKRIAKAGMSLALGLSALAPWAPLTIHAADPDPISVGVLQYVEHESLDQNYQGFKAGLEAAGYHEGKNLTLNYVNASGDTKNLQSMTEGLAKNSDYLFAIATPAAQAMANIIKDKPIYISSVSDPVAAGLVKSVDKPETNVTGTLDAGPIKEQIALIKQVAPEAKKVGILYNSGEANAVSESEIARKLLEEQAYEVTEATITSTNDISQVMGGLVKNVDVVFVVTDNTIASAMSLVGNIATDAKKPLVGGSKDMVLENGLVTYGLDYYKLGEQTANMLVKQIKEGTETAEIPVERAKDLELVVNKANAEKLGIDPDAIKVAE